MTILVEEKLKFVKYADGQPTIKDRLAFELNTNPWNARLPKWDFEIEAAKAASKIHVSGNERTFLAEGYDYVYYVSEDQVHYISKEALFCEAIQKTIAEDIVEAASYNYYDTDDPSCEALVSKVAAAVLKHVDTIEGHTIRIPYPMEMSLEITPPGQDYSKIPKCYCISDDDCSKIANALSATIKAQFHLEQTRRTLPVYSYNWFISKITLE